MTLTVTHGFVSNIADDPKAAAAGEVLPSHWNANHTVSGTISSTAVTGLRTLLAADTTFWVSTTGSNSATGLSSTTAWATIQFAADTLMQKYDFAGFQPTIQVEAGTYVEELNLGATVGLAMTSVIGVASFGAAPRVIIQGDTTTPDNVFINYPDDGNAAVQISGPGAFWEVRGFKISCQGVTNFGYGFLGSFQFYLVIGAIHFGQTGGGPMISASQGSGYILVPNPFGAYTNTITADGPAERLLEAARHCVVDFEPNNLVLGAPTAFNSNVILADQQAEVIFNPGSVTGTANGSKFSLDSLSLLNTFTNDPTSPPGNTAGTISGGSMFK